MPTTLSAALAVVMLAYAVLLIPRGIERIGRVEIPHFGFYLTAITFIGGLIIGAVLNAIAARSWWKRSFRKALLFNSLSFALPVVGITLSQYFVM